jgi:hypothetical protein
VPSTQFLWTPLGGIGSLFFVPEQSFARHRLRAAQNRIFIWSLNGNEPFLSKTSAVRRKKADEKDRQFWLNYRRLLRELALARPKRGPRALKGGPDAEIGTYGGLRPCRKLTNTTLR